MSKIDEIIAELKKDTPKVSESKEVVIKETVTKKPFPFLNILLVMVILVMGFFLFRKETSSDDIQVDLNIAESTQKYENLYSTYKAQVYTKLADLVLNETSGINTEEQLKLNAQALLEKARYESLGKLDEIDNQFFSKIEVFKDNRKLISEFLKQKSEGFQKAGK